MEAFLATVANEKLRHDCRVVMDIMAGLGKYKTGKSCLYINKLEDIHLPTLKKLIEESVVRMKKAHG